MRGAACWVGICALAGAAHGGHVQVIREVTHGVSAPLRRAALKAGGGGGVVRMHVTGLGVGFNGPQGTYPLVPPPPDANASVGATQVVETVNVALAVFDKGSGAAVLGPVYLYTLWSGFNTACSQDKLADPLVLYDKQAGRWVIRIVTLTNPYTTCFAVSTSSDATGSYYLYAFEQPGLGTLAGQRLGVWPDGYYMAQRTYVSVTSYIGPQACALDRTQMLAGQAATMQCFQISQPNLYAMLPSDLDGATPPPAGSPNYFMVRGPGNNSLYLYQMHVDFSNPANSMLTGPAIMPVTPYIPAPQDSVASIPQPGTRQLLDANGSELMPRLAYRNFAQSATPHESLVVTHAVETGMSSSTRVGMRWYEIRSPGSTPVVYQQNTYSPDGADRWMGSIAMDKLGDIALGYSVSSPLVFPGIRYTGRVPSDPLGAMRGEVSISEGGGSQIGSARWGDYTSMSVDPSDDCTLWYTNQYVPSTDTMNWATVLYAFKFPSCQ